MTGCSHASSTGTASHSGAPMFERMLIGLAIVGICSSASFNAQSRRPLQPDDIFSLKIGRRPAHQPRRRVGRLHGHVARPEGGQLRHRHLHGRRVRRRAGPADERARSRRTRRAGAPTAATSRSSRRATARSRRCSCSIAAAATRSRSPTTRPARRRSRGRPTARSWRCSSPSPTRTIRKASDRARTRSRSRTSSRACSSCATAKAT